MPEGRPLRRDRSALCRLVNRKALIRLDLRTFDWLTDWRAAARLSGASNQFHTATTMTTTIMHCSLLGHVGLSPARCLQSFIMFSPHSSSIEGRTRALRREFQTSSSWLFEFEFELSLTRLKSSPRVPLLDVKWPIESPELELESQLDDYEPSCDRFQRNFVKFVCLPGTAIGLHMVCVCLCILTITFEFWTK